MKTRLQVRLAAVRTSRSMGDLAVNRDWVQAQIERVAGDRSDAGRPTLACGGRRG